MAGNKGSSCASSGEGKKESKDNAWEAVSIVLRIATVGLSLASAITTLTASSSTQCVVDDGSPAGAASSSTDYGSFTYSSVASLVSAVLQGVVICLEVVGEEKWASTVEFIDAVVLALTSTSAPLLFAADNITSCGPPRRRNNNGARRQSKSLDDKLRPAAGFGTGAVSCMVAMKVANKLMEHKKATPTPGDDSPLWVPTEHEVEQRKPQPESPPRPPCSCPTVTPPCCCENRDPCGASTC